MKKLTLLGGILLICSLSSAQKTVNSPSKIGLAGGLGNSDVGYPPSVHMVGKRAINGKSYMAFGINYLKPLKKWMDLEAGIEYSSHKFRASSAPTPEIRYWDTKASLITIPVAARFNFLRYFYGQAGMLIDVAGSNYEFDSQNGIGGILGLGAKYDFKNGLSVFANPSFRQHGIIAPGNKKLFKNERLLERGTRIGLMYAVGKKPSGY